MTPSYRLAVTRQGESNQVQVERDGRLLPLRELLDAEVAGRLSGELTDLLPLLTDWVFWRGRLPVLVQRAEAAFVERGAPALIAQFRPPVAAPGKVVCIGSNYLDHIDEMEIPVLPDYPYAFLKPASTLRGCGQPVEVPAIAHMIDWEAELGVVVGASVRDVPAEQALAAVAGYVNFNDLSARDWLESRPAVGIDWVRHKAFDGFGPIGPFFTPAEAVPDPQNLPVRLWVNGVLKQDSSTSQMIFGVAAIISHLSQIMTLEPGDIIATGSPAGVGYGREPKEFLKAGDEIAIEVGPLGRLVTRLIPPERAQL